MKFLSIVNKAKKSGTRTSKRTALSKNLTCLRITRSYKSVTGTNSAVKCQSAAKKSLINPKCKDGSLDMRFNVNKGQIKFKSSPLKSDKCLSVASASTVSASLISFKTDSQKPADFKLYEESELTYFDTVIGATLQHNLIF